MQRRRAAVVWVLGVGIVLAGVMLHRVGPEGFPGCLFHRVSGWYCPGCGMTRATDALLRGNPGEAFRFNPLGVAGLLGLVLLSLVHVLSWLRGGSHLLRWRPGPRAAWWALALVLAYWVLRNLPFWPFTWMAPA